MNRIFPSILFKTMLAIFFLISACSSSGKKEIAHTFEFEMNFTYPGDPVFIFDHLTGDISDWWDHSFSPNPYKIFIEPRPGGGFYEIFDEMGNGALHATVIYAKRGEMLRMEGPLGLSGEALTLVSTYTLKPSGTDETLLTLIVKGTGGFPPETPDLVRGVWEHFLWERFKPYIEDHHSAKN